MHTRIWWMIWKERPFRCFKAARFMNYSPLLAIWPTLLKINFTFVISRCPVKAPFFRDK